MPNRLFIFCDPTLGSSAPAFTHLDGKDRFRRSLKNDLSIPFLDARRLEHAGDVNSVTEWDRILSEKWYSQYEPEEIVVSFAEFLLNENKKPRVLDLGCGAGRHQVYMAKKGFETHGVDISMTGLNLSRKRLIKQKSKVYLAKCDMKMLPYVERCFDAIICLNAIYHQKSHGIKQTVSEIQRTLSRNGLVLVNFLSKRTYSYGKGEKVEQDTFVEQEGIEKGVLHHFADRRQINQLFQKFEILDLKLAEKRRDGKIRSRWVLTARNIGRSSSGK